MERLKTKYQFTPRKVIYVESDEEKFLYIDMGQAIGIGSAIASGIVQKDYQVQTVSDIRFRHGFIRNTAYENQNVSLFFEYLKKSGEPDRKAE